jgi:signal peptidase I
VSDPAPPPGASQPQPASAAASKPAPKQPFLTRHLGLAAGAAIIVEWVVLIAGTLLIALVLRAFVITAFWIPTASMEHTLDIRDRILVNQLAKEPSRQEIAVFRAPDSIKGTGPDDLVKRVIGEPGDTVEARDNQVYVNGEPLDEPYLSEGIVTEDFGPTKVPEDSYFMMGDNRSNSSDSRVFGAIPADDIVGEAFFRFWPLNRLGGV